jgi:demethylmenaquinone methyltransferase/2-methoxy-6-polyprenyl-1,4-benzoquinol methylase
MKDKSYTAPEKAFIRSSFNSITPRYDFLNQILSFGMSERWRQKSCEILLGGEVGDRPRAKTILDLGCGTGKFLECFLKAKKWDFAVGLDFSSEMLKKARETVEGAAVWIEEDFEKLPFLEGSFDLIISAFTLRSVQDVPAFLKEINRVLSPGGRVALLDLTCPRGITAFFFYPYLRWILPALGGIISGNHQAYHFLSSSVRGFQRPEKTVDLMENAGLRNIRLKRFAFGVATLIIASK